MLDVTALKKGLFTAECAEKNLGNLCALCVLCGEFLAFFSSVLMFVQNRVSYF